MTTTSKPRLLLDDDWTEREALEALAVIADTDDPRDSRTKKLHTQYKDRLREFMRTMGMDELRDDETGVSAELGNAPANLYLDHEAGGLTAEVIFAAFNGGYLQLNTTLWRARDTTVAPTLQSAAFSKAIREGAGTARLSVKARDATR